MQRFTIEPSSIPGQWMALDNGVPMREDGKLWLFGSAAAASNWIDEHMPMAEVLTDMSTDALREELSRLNDERADDARRTAICQELTLRMAND